MTFKLLSVGIMILMGLVILSGCGRVSTPVLQTPTPTLVPTPTSVPPTFTPTPVPPTPTPTPVPPTPTPTLTPLSQAELEKQYCESLAKRPPNPNRAPVVFCGESLPLRPTGPLEGRTQVGHPLVTEEQIRQFCQSGLEQTQICLTIIQQYGGNVQAYCLNAKLSLLAEQACQRLGFIGQNTFSEETTKPPQIKAKFIFCDEEWRRINQGGRTLNDAERKLCDK